ncbi:haloacid dehalogenase type II [Salinisphaera hydrothermalis]|uniref:(S)-2-haloacid dehalogenase n=1 Tax=Salinisphaera hydrothermalis (strain C41B8) TaxID=1304275 RepID=A0A084IQ45_SALHC|nr:haloacid dehalogenase type II [Salinisphaera hydrothermalis]KEZ78829.1 haloacid dehalogenase I [Salinisphaera hydrothermalis C41B8]
MPTTHLVFDVNETLLDLSALDPIFSDIFGDSRSRREWFASLLHWSTVTSLTGRFLDFSDLASRCLDQLAARRGIALTDEQRRRVFDTVATLPPHDDVRPALDRLRAAGFTLTALTNSAQSAVDSQFAHAGLTDMFDHVLSVEAARCYKPHPTAYGVATDALGAPPDALRLIACHDWDVTGALRAGLKAAFVARGDDSINTAGDRPDIVGPDLAAVAERIIAADS